MNFCCSECSRTSGPIVHGVDGRARCMPCHEAASNDWDAGLVEAAQQPPGVYRALTFAIPAGVVVVFVGLCCLRAWGVL
jgi:hypothetical protein